ncbi:DUF1643 domain-containing protein [Spiribacter pallidus]|uniref:DUF1643 domain-containing protein n=2 Tax=Spiribacter pallidus TaxID=1987936 RepID=UPI00349FBBF4
MERAARMSPCAAYRYDLWRRWELRGPVLLWILLNPSTADADRDDATTVRCIRFAARWGYGAIRVVNLFGMRATDPRHLYKVQHPTGRQNDETIREALQTADGLVCAWGNNGRLNGRGLTVRDMLRRNRCEPHIFGLTRLGEPTHPLYVGYSAVTHLWRINASADTSDTN